MRGRERGWLGEREWNGGRERERDRFTILVVLCTSPLNQVLLFHSSQPCLPASISLISNGSIFDFLLLFLSGVGVVSTPPDLILLPGLSVWKEHGW